MAKKEDKTKRGKNRRKSKYKKRETSIIDRIKKAGDWMMENTVGCYRKLLTSRLRGLSTENIAEIVKLIGPEISVLLISLSAVAAELVRRAQSEDGSASKSDFKVVAKVGEDIKEKDIKVANRCREEIVKDVEEALRECKNFFASRNASNEKKSLDFPGLKPYQSSAQENLDQFRDEIERIDKELRRLRV